MSETRRWSVRGILPQPAVAVILTALALCSLAALAAIAPLSELDVSPRTVGLTLGLTAAIVAAYRYPVHLRHQMKVVPVTGVYYLLAVLVPPLLAAPAAGLGAVVGELTQRRRSGAYPSDMITEGARRLLLVLLGGVVAHANEGAFARPFLLPATLLMLATLDVLTAPLVMAPMGGDRPLRVLIVAARASWLADGVQYLVALLGAVAASRFLWTLPLLIVPIALVHIASKIMKELHEETKLLLESMADAVDLRDTYTGGHSRRVTEYTMVILRGLGLQGPEVELIIAAARVHDIGKIGIPDAVLHKAGKLTEEERALMEMHPVHGATLLRRHRDFARGTEIVLHHHERWDGEGYPHRLQGMNIPFGARVVAVADSFDAMTSDRPYRRGMSVEEAQDILRAGRGKQWDSTIVDALLQSLPSVQAAA